MAETILKTGLPRLVPLAILAVSAGALVTAYTAQYAFGMEPCILCLYQRVPYAATGLLAILALGLPEGGRVRAAIAALCSAVFLIGAGIAFYHVGVEQHWWVSAASCGGPGAGEMTIETLRTQLMQKQPKACDEINWTVFGVSIASYNVAVSLFLAAGSLGGAIKIRNTPPQS